MATPRLGRNPAGHHPNWGVFPTPGRRVAPWSGPRRDGTLIEALSQRPWRWSCMSLSNLAARAGAWSARHRKRAIIGWFAFVLIAAVLGGALGTRTVKHEGSGESGRAATLL